MFLDAENHLQTVSEMDESMSKTNAVQDYVKTYKKHYQSLVSLELMPLPPGFITKFFFHQTC